MIVRGITIPYLPRIVQRTTRVGSNALPDVLDKCLHHTSLNVSDEVTLDQLNTDHNTVLLTVNSALTAQILNRLSDKEVRWDVYWEYLNPIIFPSDEYQSIDELQTGIDAISSIIVSSRMTGEVNRPQKDLQHFLDLSDFILEKLQWIRDYGISRFEADVQEARNSKSVWKLANRVKFLVEVLTHKSMA